MNTHEIEIKSRPAVRPMRWLGLCAVAVFAGASLLQAGTGTAGSAPSGNTAKATAPLPELELGRSDLHDYDPPAPGSYTLPVVKAAADGEVLDSEGRLRSLRTMLDGRVTILSFVYLRCASPNACPYATGVLRQIHEVTRKDPLLARRLQLITLSFDPGHDTPQRMADYGSLFRGTGGADWHFLTTRNEQDLKPILEAYDQTVDRKANMNDPLGPYFHPVRVYLVDREGRIRNIYSFGMMDPRMIVTDVRTVLLESPNPAVRH
jgi:cytochrome oxidase Cu insertion factor (SCO1/SenC/PrrC family)